MAVRGRARALLSTGRLNGADSFAIHEIITKKIKYIRRAVLRLLCLLIFPCVFQAAQSLQCGVCLQVVRRDSLLALPCQHSFCKACWEQHCTVLVKDGMGVGECCALSMCACVSAIIPSGVTVAESFWLCSWSEVGLFRARTVLVLISIQ